MIANSAPLTTAVYGKTSGLTKEQLQDRAIKLTTNLIGQQVVAKMNVRIPTIPSNQTKIRGK